MDNRSEFLALLMDLTDKGSQTQREVAGAIGVGENYISRIKRGANPSPQLLLALRSIHEQVLSGVALSHYRDRKPSYGSGETTVDLPSATIELAQQQVANGRFRDLREYLVHLISQDSTRQQQKAFDLAVNEPPPKKRNQKPKSAGKHGGN